MGWNLESGPAAEMNGDISVTGFIQYLQSEHSVQGGP